MEYAIMAVLAIVGSIVSGVITSQQQKHEFNQQQDLLNQQQQYQSEREDLAYSRNNISGQYDDMLSAGFNPILAANALMGGNGITAASTSGSPSAPTTNSAIGALQSMFSQGGQNLYDLVKNNAEIENIRANTNKTDIEAGILPRDYMLRSLSTTKQLEVWDESVRQMKKTGNLTDQQVELLKQQVMYYGKLSEAQIDAYRAQIAEAYSHATLMREQLITEDKKQHNLDADTALKGQQSRLAASGVELTYNQSSSEYYRSESLRIAQEFEKKLGDIPLTADAQRYVKGLVNNGDVDGVRDFYLNILGVAQNQSLGESLGGQKSHIGLPFGIFSKDYPNPALRSYTNYPVWNFFNYPD